MTRRIIRCAAALAVALGAAVGAQAAMKYYPGKAILKLYKGIPTVQLSTLEASPKYPDKPDEILFVDLAEVPTNIDENYGGVIEFLWTAPQTGQFQFSVAADDNADLWISTDETAANLKLVAREPEWNPVRSFGSADRRGCADGIGGQPPCANISQPISFTANKRYLFRGRYKEAGGGDNYAVAYREPATLPFDGSEEPIPGSEIGVMASDEIAALGISSSAPYGYVGDTVRISASLYTPPDVSGATIAWLKDGAVVAGATGAAYDFKIADADTGAESKTIKFKARLTAGGKSVETAEVSVLAIKPGPLVLSPGFVTAQFFHDIGGTAVQGLLDDPKYQSNQPDATRVLNALDTPNGYGENYGASVAGFILPKETGQYRFFIRSDDASQFYLNPVANGPAPIPGGPELRDVPIAEETGCCDAFHEADGSPETSEPVQLTAGQKYAFVALVKEGGGGDYLQVAWRKEGDSTPAGALQPLSGPIIGGLVQAAGFSVSITKQPTPPPAPGVIEGTSYTLSAAATVVPNPSFLYYQWQLNGADIPGANSASYNTPKTLTAGTYKYRAVAVTAGDRKATSEEVTVTVVPDTFPPVPRLGVLKKGNDFELGVGFNEAVKPDAAKLQANYSVSPGSIASFRFVEQSGHAVIRVAGVAAGGSVTVTVKNVEDLKGNKIPAAGATATTTLASKFGWVGVGGNEANESKNTTAFNDDAVAFNDKDFDLVSGGTAHWDNYDELTFVYEEITGDFDRKVRVEYQDPTSQWARAGLMVREALDEGIRRDALFNEDSNPTGVKMSQVFTIRVNPTVGADNGDGTSVPGNNSYEEIHRPRAGYRYGGTGEGVNAIYNIGGGFGGAPPYPNAWMRVQRQGQTIRAWKSSDGLNWGDPANVTYTNDPETPEDELLSDKLYFGVFYAPELNNNSILSNDLLTRSAVAKFRDYGPVGGSGPAPTIGIARDGANVKITFTGTLEAADTVAGPYAPVAGATSPETVPTTAAQKYYRASGN